MQFPNQRLPLLLLLVPALLLLHLLQGPHQAPCPPSSPLSSLSQLMPLVETGELCGPLAPLQTLYRIELETIVGRVVPPALQAQLEVWLQGDRQLLQEARSQWVLQVSDRLTGEATHYNPLRASRPRPQGSREGGRGWAEEESRRSKEGCHFCNPANLTAHEEWGDLPSPPSCFTAANIFPVAGPRSGLILAASHSVLDIGSKELNEMLQCAVFWYQQVERGDPGVVFPMLMWDTFSKAGASQAHPHFQIWLGRNSYSGHWDTMARTAEAYSEASGRDYWQELLELHLALGLGVRHGPAVAIVPLTSRRDHEVMVISPSFDSHFLELLGAVLETYHEVLGVFCHSMSIALPPLKPRSSGGLPALARLGSRGDCSSPYSDVNAFDLYSFWAHNVDPFQTAAALKTTVEKLRQNGEQL